MDFGRVITAMVTPFNDQLEIDWTRVEPLVDYLINEQKSDGIVVCGTTGESPTLTEDEKLKLIAAVAKHAQGRCRIIAGTGSNSTAHTIEFSKEVVKQGGIDALLLVAPYYNRPTQEGLYQHFKTVAEAVELPVILYNVPGRTGVNIDADTTIRLSRIPNIVATKDCSDTNQLSRIVFGAAEGFTVYSGEDSMTLPAVAVGCHGIISVASHVIGKEMQELIAAYTSGNIKRAAEINAELLPVLTGMFCAPSPAPVKYALKLKGFDAGGVRLPLVHLNEEDENFVASLIK
ncbi:4-hydroxy-tetrahydrodipicolinate synthase [Paenibacillus lutrae]|uniref:4-hydroxy-tetrahydrodipicolinate synthase n=1 Tax=Paenibacillus lutrae TaxID=2078573 RepID=A0A7X3FG14_9BACL|nr:4-hydroxy-tetrahydrodipicolinate synthase [Paenibacillus lutrae]